MIVAIAATSTDTEAEVSMHGARAPYYLFFDTESGFSEALSNPVSQAERAAGSQAAAFLISKGVDKIVAGRFGSKFRIELEDGGIECIEKIGKITEVVTGLGVTV